MNTPLTPEESAALLAKNQAERAEAERVKAEKKAAADAEKAAAKQARDDAKAKKEAEKAEAKAIKDAEKSAKAEAKAIKDAEKSAADADKLNNKAPESNGVRRPKEGTLCGDLWALYDSLSAAKGSPVARSEITAALAGQPNDSRIGSSTNEATVSTQFAAWRKFFGIVGRTPAAVIEVNQAAA